MNDQDSLASYPDLTEQCVVDRFVRQVSDTIHDPCAMAMGVALGMDEMGLIRDVTATKQGDRWNVQITVRLTSPGCEYFFAFKDNLEQKLRGHPQLGVLSIELDPTLDWTPDSLSARAHERLNQRRRELWSRKRVVRGPTNPAVIRLQAS